MNPRDIEKMNLERSKRLRRDWALTGEQRIIKFLQLQELAEKTLAANPVALEAFHRRNHQKRTQARVRELENRIRREVE